MFHEFAHRHTPCLVDGVPDLVILSRDTRSTTIIGKEYQYNGVFAPESLVKNGSLVETKDSYFVQTLRLTTEQDNYCSLIKTNAAVEIQWYKKTFDQYDNATTGFETVQSECIAFAQLITARMRQEDPGLLPSAVYVLQMQTSAVVRDPRDAGVLSPDRVLLLGKPYKVESVDRVKYPNLLHVQLSEDVR